MSGIRFRCRLEEQPGYLVPRRYRNAAAGEVAGAGAILHPRCWLDRHAPRRDVRGAGVLAVDGDDELLWARDDTSGVHGPFVIGKYWAQHLERVDPGGKLPSCLPPELVCALNQAGLAVSPCQLEVRRSARSDVIAACRRRLALGYAPVDGLLHPYLIGELRRYYRRIIRAGLVPLGDLQSPRRHAVHNEPVARYFHHELTGFVNELVAEPVRPSYAYVVSYLGGAELPGHVDREQCEFSLAICIDFTPEPECETPWPLNLESAGGRVTIYQALGDGLLYRGRQLPHHRYPLPAGMTSTSLLFHYVRDSFTGELD